MLARSTSEKLHRGRRSPLAWRVLRRGSKALTILVIAGVLVPLVSGGVALGTLLFVRLPGSLPEKKPVFEALPSTVYDAAGNKLAVFSDFDLTVPMTQPDVPEVLKLAVVAAEDQRFYEHHGVDPQGVARAAWVSYQGGEILQGGSTITQQYIKNAYLNFDVKFSRKLREAILATQLERQMTKDEILFNYLNTIYFGSGAYGAGAAAQSYFSKPVSQLNLSEAATLAGVIPSPTAWSPRVSLEDAEFRRQLVLDTMVQVGFVSKAEADAAKALPLWLVTDGAPPGPVTAVSPAPEKGAFSNPYFVDYVQEELLQKYGAETLYRGGLRIDTSLDPTMQQLAQTAVSDRLASYDPSVEMAMAVVDPRNGLVKAMVGGRDYNVSQVNLATGGSLGMQPGSSMKSFTLAAAFERGYRPESSVPAPAIYTVPGCDGEGCQIKNSEGSGYGSASLRVATSSSINTAYASLAYEIGVPAVAEMSHRLGVRSITPDRDYGLSLTLGAYEVSALDMASAYGAFANKGIRQNVTGVVRVTDKTGQVIEDNSSRPGTRVLSEAVASNVTDVLKGVITGGTGRNANIGRPAAGKTGTTDDYHDAWFVGFTPQLSAAVWMGHRDEVRSLGGVSGGSHPAIAWGQFMRQALNDQPVIDFPPPGQLASAADVAAAGPATPSAGNSKGVGQDGPARSTDGGFGKANEDVTLRPGSQDQLAETPNDCGGPCRL